MSRADSTAVRAATAGRPSRGLIALLAALAAIGALSTNIILPAFPAIAASLGIPASQLGLTLSIFFVVFAFGQLLVGPLSDRYGRRRLVIGGLLVFAAGSAVCALAGDLSTLMLGRAVQAAGVCAASVLARAIARDLFEGESLARVLSMVIVAMAAAPGFSPLLGGLAQQSIGWRMSFLGVGALGVMLALWYAVRLPETHHPSRRAPLALGPVTRGYATLLLDGRFLRPAMAVACVIGALYAFFTAAPIILLGPMGLSTLGLGIFFAATVPVVFAAGLAAPRLARRWGAARTARVGILLALAGGALLCILGLSAEYRLAPFVACLCVFLVGMGIVNPLSTAMSLAPFGAQAGAASAMLGFLQMIGAAIGATLVTKIDASSTLATLGAIIVVAQLLALVSTFTPKAAKPVATPG
jgi:MFS transporter, DHA1 family, multidrug resistance protein